MEGSLGPFDRDKARQNITRAPGYLHPTERQNSLLRLWSAICFKIMTRSTCGVFQRILAIIPATRYTCVFLPRILEFFPALWRFHSQVYDHFLTNAYIYAHKKAHTYALQTSMWYTGSQKVVVYIRGTELYRQQKTPSCTRFGSYSMPSQ